MKGITAQEFQVIFSDAAFVSDADKAKQAALETLIKTIADEMQAFLFADKWGNHRRDWETLAKYLGSDVKNDRENFLAVKERCLRSQTLEDRIASLRHIHDYEKVPGNPVDKHLADVYRGYKSQLITGLIQVGILDATLDGSKLQLSPGKSDVARKIFDFNANSPV